MSPEDVSTRLRLGPTDAVEVGFISEEPNKSRQSTCMKHPTQ
jgi:hypothetical protein